MNNEEVLSNLCYYDKRNPDMCFTEEDDVIEPRNNCYCDNCFYGRDALALEILKLKKRKD